MAAKKAPAPPAPSAPRLNSYARRDGGITVAARVVEIAIGLLAIASLVALWRNAATTVFAADECFHAYVARWIAAHGALPRVIPELYSGMPYFYPPLFHLVGALAYRIAGQGSLPYLNVILLGVLYAVLYFTPGETRTARRWAVALIAANPSLMFYAVRFYAETLATLLAIATLLLLLRVHARPTPAIAAALGLAGGLGVVAKQPGVLLPALFALLAIVDLARGERRRAALYALAFGVAAAVSLPLDVRNALLFGSPFYPPVTTAAERALDAMNTGIFSKAPLTFYFEAYETAGPVVTLLGLAALAFAALRGPRDLRAGLLALIVGFVIVAPRIPRFEPRHLNPFVAVAAVLGAMALADRVRGRRAVGVAIGALLVVWGAIAFPARNDYRRRINHPPELMEGYRAVRDHVPAGRRVLCLWTYDTFYHSGRPTTWPIPWSPSADLLPMFTTQDPAVFLATMDRQGVGYILVPRGRPPATFDGGNYPVSFVRCVEQLVDAHQLRVDWESLPMALVSRVR